MNKKIYLWKSLRKGTVSYGSDHKWRVGKWYKIDDELDICNVGFHASENIIDAMSYVSCGVLAKVEVRGKSIIQDDKQAWSEMRIVKKWKWTKKDSVALAIYSAELVLKNFEKEYPKDKRPREAIEAAKRVLRSNTAKNRFAALVAAETIWSATRTIISYPACSAACSAAEAAESAVSTDFAWLAESAAWAAGAARSAILSATRIDALANTKEQIHNWIIKQINE